MDGVILTNYQQLRTVFMLDERSISYHVRRQEQTLKQLSTAHDQSRMQLRKLLRNLYAT